MKTKFTPSETRILRNYARALRNLSKTVTFRPDGRIRRTPELNAALHAVVLADDKFLTPFDKYNQRRCRRDAVWFAYCDVEARWLRKSPLNVRLRTLLQNEIYAYQSVKRAAHLVK